MSGWMIVVDRLSDLPAEVAGYPAMTARDYIMQPRATRRTVPKILNLSRSYGYQTLGYYCSLLAEARGHKVVPTVTTVLELTRRTLLRLCPDRAGGHAQPHHPPPGGPAHRLVPAPGLPGPGRRCRASPGFGRQLFDWFRCPILEVFVKAGDSWRVRKLASVSITELGEAGKDAAGRGHHRRMSASPGSRRAPRRRHGSRSASCSTPRRSCRPRTWAPSATSSASPRPWGWASR